MTLRLYDTAARGVRDFRPVNPPHVTLYMCGPAVQATPHIGHLRSAVCFDILIRWLEASGYEVIYCRNVADIDDKILTVAADQATNWWQVAERNLRLFRAAYDLLGCRPPDVEPRATGHIPQMVQLLGRLIDTGHAHVADGNAYFDVASDPGYGSLSKRDEAADFLLWKAARPGEPSWDTPWGPGRPGPDLGCAAMSATYLGSSFDIHGGGRDLLFPHHENERAAGDAHAGYWWHSNYLGVSGGKTSRLDVADVLTRVRPQELRYYLGQSHYRALLEYSEEELDEAAAAYQRIERFVHRASDLLNARTGPQRPARDDLPMSFADAMDADLGVPSALASLHATVRDGNHAIADGDIEEVRAHLTLVRAMLTVLGLDPLDPRWPDTERNERLQAVVDALVRLALDERDRARQRKDYAAADSINQTLEKIGLVVEDTAQGPRWELRQ